MIKKGLNNWKTWSSNLKRFGLYNEIVWFGKGTHRGEMLHDCLLAVDRQVVVASDGDNRREGAKVVLARLSVHAAA